MDKILYAIENFKNMQELIRFADQKAGAIIVVYGFILTMTYETSKPLVFEMPCHNKACLLSISTFLVGIVLLYLILSQIFNIFNSILKPRLANNYKYGESCLYYFEHVAAKNKPEVVACLANMDENTMISDVSSQIYEVSKTLNAKMQMIVNAINNLTYVVITMLLFIFLAKCL